MESTQAGTNGSLANYTILNYNGGGLLKASCSTFTDAQ